MHRLLIAVALLLLAPLAAAQVYTWKDASGTVHYSQEAPAQGTKYKEVKTTGTAAPLAAPSSTPSPAGSPEADNTAAPVPAKPVPDTAANRKQLCSSLTSNITALQGSTPVVMQVSGKTTALDAAQRKQQLSSAQAQYNQFCQSK